MGLLDGKRVLVTGVLTKDSLAFAVAQLAQQEGAELVLTGAGRGLSLTQRTARKLSGDLDVLEFDVTEDAHTQALADALAAKWDRVDGALHAIAFAPEAALGGNFLSAQWDDVAVAMRISAWSLRALADAVTPLMTEGGSIVGLDFDAQVAWPGYDWMGVCKAALESTSRYLARDLGPRGIRCEPGRRRARAHAGRAVDPRLRAVRGRVGRPGAPGVVRPRPRGRGQGLRRPAVRLVPRHDRRDHPRRRRLPRHGRVASPTRSRTGRTESVG